MSHGRQPRPRQGRSPRESQPQCRTATRSGVEWHNPIAGGDMTRPYFEPLAGIDTWFLYAERHEAPLHIGATYIFEGTPRVKGGRGALGLARTIEERLHLVPRYRQKLMWPPGGIGKQSGSTMRTSMSRTTPPRCAAEPGRRQNSSRLRRARLRPAARSEQAAVGGHDRRRVDGRTHRRRQQGPSRDGRRHLDGRPGDAAARCRA